MIVPSKFVRFHEDRAELALGKEIVERSGLRPGEELSVFAPGGSLLVLERAEGRKCFFCGRLETLSIGEIFGLVTSTIRSGTLVLQSPSERRRIVFEEGQVLSAASTDLSERLGPVLWRKGLVALEQLQECEPKVSAGVKLGKLLVDSGFLTPAQLYRGFQQQVREIVLGAFLETEGDFAFLEGECNELNAVKLPERTRDLVLEGMTRAERMASLRQSYELGAAPARIPAPGATPPEGVEQAAIWEKIDGRRSLRDVVRASRLGEFSALVAFADLVRAGRVRHPPPSRPAIPEPMRPSITGGPQQRYAAALWRIRQELEAEGAGQRLDSFFTELKGEQRRLFEGVLQEGGGLDLDQLFANAQGLRKGPMGRALALEALDNLVSFALFDARNVLPGRKADELSHDVLRMLRGTA